MLTNYISFILHISSVWLKLIMWIRLLLQQPISCWRLRRMTCVLFSFFTLPNFIFLWIAMKHKLRTIRLDTLKLVFCSRNKIKLCFFPLIKKWEDGSLISNSVKFCYDLSPFWDIETTDQKMNNMSACKNIVQLDSQVQQNRGKRTTNIITPSVQEKMLHLSVHHVQITFYNKKKPYSFNSSPSGSLNLT
jgi:hypothetical protein